MDANDIYHLIVRAGTVLSDTAFAADTAMHMNRVADVEGAQGRRYIGTLDGINRPGHVQVSEFNGTVILLLVGPDKTGLAEAVMTNKLNDEVVSDFAHRALDAVKNGVALKDSVPA